MGIFPPPDWVDGALLAGVIVLLVVAYGIFPSQFVQISAWLTIFTLYLTWMTYYGWKILNT